MTEMAPEEHVPPHATPECRCGRPTRDSAYFCDDCGHQLSAALGDVPWLDEELDVSTARIKGVDYAGAVSRGAETPSPVNWGASEAKAHLRAVLTSWARFCHDERVRNSSPHRGLPDDTLPALSRWLMWRIDGLSLLDIGPEAVDEITEAVKRSRRVIDRPADKLYAGRCSTEYGAGGDEIVRCPEDLYATVGAKVVPCRVCGTDWDVEERRAWLLAEAEEVLATAVEISRAVSWLGSEPLTADRVRQWAARDRLIMRGHDKKGRPMYRVGDAIDLLAAASKHGAA